MSDGEKEKLVDAVAALSDVSDQDRARFKNWLGTLSPFALRERYEILIEQRVQDARDANSTYALMMQIAEDRITGGNNKFQIPNYK